MPMQNPELVPFLSFPASVWSSFRHSKDELKLTAEDVRRCLAFNDRISLTEVRDIYLPLSRLIWLYYNSRHSRSQVIQRFLGQSIESVPFIISISGSVSVGKTTTARLLRELLASWPTSPRVDLITTDGFLYPNAVLEEREIMGKKGFPISYDVKRLMRFIFDVKEGRGNLRVPVYSHFTYDVVPNEFTVIDHPDILIIEGVNVLQNGADYPDVRNHVFITDLIDFSIYVDAEERDLIRWYVDRFMKLTEQAFDDPNAYFHRYAHIPAWQAENLATLTWQAVNHVNLIENILPCRSRASLILHKAGDHRITEVMLRR
ncbi:MAG: type I pantothenate kinase [Succinivibrionaceae bacterium]|nr:type I pantothenate kinase [Succinivibrionaceae bacterium]